MVLEDLQVRFQAMERNLRNEENKNQNLIHQKIDIDTKHKQETRMLERQLKECKEVTEAHYAHTFMLKFFFESVNLFVF